MSFKSILLPLLAQVMLTFAVWTCLYARRIPEILRKGIDPQKLQDRAMAHDLLPVSASASNNLKNLFEMPVLFYVAILVSLALLIQDAILVRLAWGYVVLRTVHSFIHCTYNNVNQRFAVYALSSVLLLLMWLRLASFIVTY
jgi:hypothetical protein